ncbi:MAG: ribosome recycling factor [Candidatus Sumerlaeia bacterium]|nr:ribosome recycling factor [Candidatus Sumerlaeia bacterium]
MATINELIHQATEKMKKAVEVVETELSQLRTGKASVALLDPVRVNAYGSDVPIKQVASVTTPDAKTISIQPWDKNLIPAIEKAIMAANLGLTPINDGKIIRINIPPLTEERRKELVKVAHKIAEEGRVAVRNVRRHINEEIKKLEKEHKISEDDRFKYIDKIQELTDKSIENIDAILKKKEAEIMEV